MSVITREQFLTNYAISKSLNLTGLDLSGIDLSNLRNTDPLITIMYCDFTRTNLKGANLSNTIFSYCTFFQTDFTNTNLERSIIAGTEHLRGANFSGASLKDFRLDDINIIDLSGATFFKTNMQNANFRGVHFGGCDMRFANMDGAKVDQSRFHGTDLRGANLKDMKLDAFTKFDHAYYDANTTWPDGLIPSLIGAIFVDGDIPSMNNQQIDFALLETIPPIAQIGERLKSQGIDPEKVLDVILAYLTQLKNTTPKEPASWYPRIEFK